jgi:SAM-dependent methyltransferase
MSETRLVEHRRLWARKPVLARIYDVWFEALLRQVPNGASVVEVGAGPGFLSEEARRRRSDLRWLATDVTTTDWNDVVADAHRLPLRDASVDAVLGLDVLHHLAHPGQFLSESARVLRPDGRLALIEPWVTPLSYPIYRWLHQEGCTLGIDPWQPFAGQGAGKDAFDGNAAVPWKIHRAVSPEGWGRFGLERPTLRLMNGFAYLLSLGFREASLLPASSAGFFLGLDRWTEPLAPIFGLRALLVWQRVG